VDVPEARLEEEVNRLSRYDYVLVYRFKISLSKVELVSKVKR